MPRPPASLFDSPRLPAGRRRGRRRDFLRPHSRRLTWRLRREPSRAILSMRILNRSVPTVCLHGNACVINMAAGTHVVINTRATCSRGAVSWPRLIARESASDKHNEAYSLHGSICGFAPIPTSTRAERRSSRDARLNSPFFTATLRGRRRCRQSARSGRETSYG